MMGDVFVTELGWKTCTTSTRSTDYDLTDYDLRRDVGVKKQREMEPTD